MKNLNFIKNLFLGVIIGSGAIIPGVSSGVICVILGIYEKLLDCVLNLFKDYKDSIKLLFPIGLGIVIGMIIFGNVLKYLLYAYPIQISFLFIGLVLGSIPSLIKETEKKEKFKIKNFLFLIIAFIIGIAMVVFEDYISINYSTEFSFIYLFFAGMVMSIGFIVPGVSSTVILTILGVYSTYLTSIAEVFFPVLIPIGIGLVVGSAICIKVIKYLLDNFYTQTYFSIIGFTMGSVFTLYRKITFDLNGIIAVLCFLLGWIIISSIEKRV